MKTTTFTIFFISLLFISCQKKGNCMNYDLKKIGAIISLPNSYRLVDSNQLDLIVNKKDDEAFKGELKDFYIKNPNKQLLIDTLNPYNFILLSVITPYVPIDTNTLYFVIERERSLSSSSPNVSDSAFYVGSKMDSISNFKFIVSKYKRTKFNKKRIGYNYMISTDRKTIGIAFYSPEEQETRPFINSIKLR